MRRVFVLQRHWRHSHSTVHATATTPRSLSQAPASFSFGRRRQRTKEEEDFSSYNAQKKPGRRPRSEKVDLIIPKEFPLDKALGIQSSVFDLPPVFGEEKLGSWTASDWNTALAFAENHLDVFQQNIDVTEQVLLRFQHELMALQQQPLHDDGIQHLLRLVNTIIQQNKNNPKLATTRQCQDIIETLAKKILSAQSSASNAAFFGADEQWSETIHNLMLTWGKLRKQGTKRVPSGSSSYALLTFWEKLSNEARVCPPPTLDNYRMTLNYLEQEGDEKKASELLQRLCDSPSQRPDRACIHNVFRACSRAKNVEQADYWFSQMVGSLSIAPNLSTFKLVLSVSIESGAKGMSDRALELDRLRRKQYNLKPTDLWANMVLDALAREGKYKEAEEYLWNNLMEEDRRLVDTATVHMTLKACDVSCRQNRKHKKLLLQAAEHADRILEKFRDLFDREVLSEGPTGRTYSTLLAIWARNKSTRAIQRTLSILREMESRYQSGEVTMKPDTI